METRNVAARMRLDKLQAIENLDDVSFRDLNAIAGDTGDRTGYGKRTTMKVELDLADRLAQALAASSRVISARPLKVIDHE